MYCISASLQVWACPLSGGRVAAVFWNRGSNGTASILGRFECNNGPYTPAAWDAARQTIVKGIAYVDVERYLTLQFELAYTARDCGDNHEALVWYEKLLANAERAGVATSEHWHAFVTRKIRPQAQQLRFEQVMHSGARDEFALRYGFGNYA